MPEQHTSTATPPSTTSARQQLRARLVQADQEVLEARRHMQYALDDLSASMECQRQVRQQLEQLEQDGAR